MRKAVLGAAAAMAVSLGTTSAVAAESRTYISGSFGLFQHRDIEDAYGDELSFEMGPYFSGAVGAALGNGARVEFELGVTAFDGDEARVSGVVLDASNVEASATILTVGGYYDIQTKGGVSPYVGVGLGFASWEIDGAVDFDGTDLAAFGEFGLNIKAGQNAVFVPSYRFLWIDNGEQGFDDSSAHIFKAGIRFFF